MRFTAVYRKVEESYVGFVQGLPGANTQGADLEEARRNLAESVELVLDANESPAESQFKGKTWFERR